MEQQLFGWENYDPIDEGIDQYYNCTLTKEVQRQTKYVDIVPTIVMDYILGKMTFIDSEGRTFREYDLVLRIK
jgi:hypothetical protein